MDLVGVVSIPFEVTSHDGIETFSFDMRPRETARVEQHFSNVTSEDIPVPDAKMEDLVSPEEETFEAQRRESVVNPSDPLRHSHVIAILRFEQELEKPLEKLPRETPSISLPATVGRDSLKGCASIGNEPQGNPPLCQS